MRHQTIRVITVALLLTLAGTTKLTGQSSTRKNFSYQDVYGNTISVSNIDNLPKPLDTTFFKTQLNGKVFNPGAVATTRKYSYSIGSLKTIESEMEFEFRLFSSPEIKPTDTVVPPRGFSRWSLRLKRINNELIIDTVKRIATEI